MEKETKQQLIVNAVFTTGFLILESLIVGTFEDYLLFWIMDFIRNGLLLGAFGWYIKRSRRNL